MSESAPGAIDWDRPPDGAELVDLGALAGGKLEQITDARDKRRVALRFDLPELRRAGALPSGARVVLVADAVRSARVTDWIPGEVPAPKSREPEAVAAWRQERRRLGRTETIAWRSFAGEVGTTKPLAVATALLLRGAAGVAVRVEGMLESDWREIVIAADDLVVRRSDREPFDLEELLRLGAVAGDGEAGA